MGWRRWTQQNLLDLPHLSPSLLQALASSREGHAARLVDSIRNYRSRAVSVGARVWLST